MSISLPVQNNICEGKQMVIEGGKKMNHITVGHSRGSPHPGVLSCGSLLPCLLWSQIRPRLTGQGVSSCSFYSLHLVVDTYARFMKAQGRCTAKLALSAPPQG